MSLVARSLRPFSLGLPLYRVRSRTGWIGVDVGTSTIKLAQVERTNAGWNLIASRILPVPEHITLDASTLASGALAEWIQPHLHASSGFVGRSLACSLPMSIAGLQSFDLPPGTDDELRQMIVQEFVSVGEGQTDDSEFAYWKSAQPAGERQEICPVTVLSIPRDVAQGVGDGLLRSRLQSRVLDGLPFAMARAVSMVAGPATNRPQAAIDWGFSSPLFVVVHHGRPVFARILRDRGLKSLFDAMSKRLQLSPVECRQLLMAYGQSRTTTGNSSGITGEVFTQLATQPLQEFTREVQKTLQYLKQRHADLLPSRLWLMGGGSVLSQVTETLSAATGIETQLWKLPSPGREGYGENPSLQALLAPAIALSKLGVPA